MTMPSRITPVSFTCEARRLGVVMGPDPADPNEKLGVLNPGVARLGDDTYLLPRLVASGNESRVGLAVVRFDDNGTPESVQRKGVVFEPEQSWERNAATAGVEDPRVTLVSPLSAFVMTYCAYGPLGPRVALATSTDLQHWRRLGPVTFGYDPHLGADLNLYCNKDAVVFPRPVSGPDGSPAWAILHRPSWNLGEVTPSGSLTPPPSVTDPRPSIWISYAPLAVGSNATFPTHFQYHRPVARPAADWEALKIGAGSPPIAIPEGWLVTYHGVSGQLKGRWPEQSVTYAAGAMVLDANDVSQVVWRTSTPILLPSTDDERNGIVPNVVFPTGLDVREPGRGHLYYGMADSRIGVAELTWPRASPQPEP